MNGLGATNRNDADGHNRHAIKVAGSMGAPQTAISMRSELWNACRTKIMAQRMRSVHIFGGL